MPTQERSVRNSVCLNHPERPAAQRCTVCFKPLCEDCARPDAAGHVFCSDACASNFERTRGSLDAWEAQRRRERSRRWRRRLVMLVILVALAAAAYRYATRHPDRAQELRQKAVEAVEGVTGERGR